jgi:hypothetical protein
MSLIEDLLERPFDQAITSKYTAERPNLFGHGNLGSYLARNGADHLQGCSVCWKRGSTHPRDGYDRDGHGWLYLFGGLSGGRRIVAASVLDRVVLVPLVLVPLAITGVFPHFLLAFAVLDPTLGIGAWLLLSRSDHPRFHSAAGTP